MSQLFKPNEHVNVVSTSVAANLFTVFKSKHMKNAKTPFIVLLDIDCWC